MFTCDTKRSADVSSQNCSLNLKRILFLLCLVCSFSVVYTDVNADEGDSAELETTTTTNHSKEEFKNQAETQNEEEDERSMTDEEPLQRIDFPLIRSDITVSRLGVACAASVNYGLVGLQNISSSVECSYSCATAPLCGCGVQGNATFRPGRTVVTNQKGEAIYEGTPTIVTNGAPNVVCFDCFFNLFGKSESNTSYLLPTSWCSLSPAEIIWSGNEIVAKMTSNLKDGRVEIDGFFKELIDQPLKRLIEGALKEQIGTDMSVRKKI